MVTFVTSPGFLIALAAVAVLLVALVVWLLRAGPARRERGGELDLSRAAARGELSSLEWDWPAFDASAAGGSGARPRSSG